MPNFRGKEPEPQQPQKFSEGQSIPFGDEHTRVEMHISNRRRSRRILPGTSRAQRSHLDTSAHIGEQRGAVHHILRGIDTANDQMPGIISYDSLEVAFIDEDTKTEETMPHWKAVEMSGILDSVAWARLKSHARSGNRPVIGRAMHVLGFGRVDDKPADDKAKEKYNGQDQLLDSY